MRRVVLADAGPLYATIDRDDEDFERARMEMINIERDGWRVAVAVPAAVETHTLLSRRLGRRIAMRWLDEINRRTIILSPEPADYTAACTTIERYPDQDISLVDALIAAVGRRLVLPIWTYDHHFDILGAQRWYPGN
jgi:predicted nucleic acid-binding protein